MTRVLGNSGAPRWYDCNRERFGAYLDLLEECSATSAEVVLHDGEADEFTSRIHVLRPDWEPVIQRYRDRGLDVFVHGPLTPEFSPLSWTENPRGTLARYQPVLRQVAEIAENQSYSTLVLHGLADPHLEQPDNERRTGEFLDTIAEQLGRWTDKVTVAIELRAFRDERPRAAATTRGSVLRVVGYTRHPAIGICWDVAHDFESHIVRGSRWKAPERAFLDRVRHLHIHDLGHDDEPHCPPTIGRVPLGDAISALPDLPITMEVRWRMAERMGDPWEILRQSYDAVRGLDTAGSGSAGK
ncbi:MAG: TIM barrel protein [Thermomicrobiaceae bacterium]